MQLQFLNEDIRHLLEISERVNSSIRRIKTKNEPEKKIAEKLSQYMDGAVSDLAMCYNLSNDVSECIYASDLELLIDEEVDDG